MARVYQGPGSLVEATRNRIPVALAAQVFGLNAAALFGVDVEATRCGLASDPLSTGISETAYLHAEGALPSSWTPRGPVTPREILGWLRTSGSRWRPI